MSEQLNYYLCLQDEDVQHLGPYPYLRTPTQNWPLTVAIKRGNRMTNSWRRIL
jgi:hypothetical protein